MTHIISVIHHKYKARLELLMKKEKEMKAEMKAVS
jgi:hypothetical protein